MRCITFLFPIVALGSQALAQWTVTNLAPTSRRDDIFFIGPDTGWAAGGVSGSIHRTYNGGDTWQIVHAGLAYLRSIEFVTPELGFCGSLDEVFLRTTNGGTSWVDISASIPAPSSICGLFAVSPQLIYGAGVWSGPGYVIRTTDGGVSWTNTALDSLADGLVDVYFLNADTGFASGLGTSADPGGVVLATTDGGNTWSVRHHTHVPGDIVWKLQSPDGVHLYGSVEAAPGTATRFVRSSDAGLTWVTDTASLDYYYMQAIGFLDPLHGWIGAESLLETLDGGVTWHIDNTLAGTDFDRFHRVSSTEAYLSGMSVYKYVNATASSPGAPPPPRPERITVQPNPATDQAQAIALLYARSPALITLCTGDGRVLLTLYKGVLAGGANTIAISVDDLAPGSYYVCMRTNQGQSAAAFVRQ